MMNNKPKAVLISDIHFTVNTLELAKQSLIEALHMASSLSIPLIICGDTLDSKALMRAECVNAILDIFRNNNDYINTTYVLVGNHDLVNERSNEHSLNFLNPYCIVIDEPTYCADIDLYMIPYMHDSQKLEVALDECPKGSTVIMHTGVMGANMGHYIQDKTSLPKETFKDYRVISGHYHKRQDIKCGPPKRGAVGLFSYVGNPYTLSFGEANEDKGYQILQYDGLLQFVPLRFRKHRVIDMTTEQLRDEMFQDKSLFSSKESSDITWLKVSGPQQELNKLKKNQIGEFLFGHSNFKLELISTDTVQLTESLAKLPDDVILDKLIDSTAADPKDISQLKKLWRELL